ncbi:hypothetical protein A3K72_03335 [Candidatus Woesearchaeota archaeon RBG_13_36_6]|nr:MAG: hypothetical protein A3K72_03335 [Candidatus Woesearchaeota archaeon RBG_13_36_6]
MINWSAMFFGKNALIAHEWIHVYQKLVVEAMTLQGLCSNTKYGCNYASRVSEKIPYHVPKEAELRDIAIETMRAVLEYEEKLESV